MNIIPVTASDFLASKNQEEWKQYNRIVTKMIDKFSEGEKNPIVYAQLVNTDGTTVKSIETVIEKLKENGFHVKFKSEQSWSMHGLKVRTAANIIVGITEESLPNLGQSLT